MSDRGKCNVCRSRKVARFETKYPDKCWTCDLFLQAVDAMVKAAGIMAEQKRIPVVVALHIRPTRNPPSTAPRGEHPTKSAPYSRHATKKVQA